MERMGGREVGREGGKQGWRMLCSRLTSVGRGEFLASSSFSPVPSSWKGNHRRAGEAAASTRAAAAAAASGRGAVPPAPPAGPGPRLTRAWKRSRSPRPPPAPSPAPAPAAAVRIAARGGSQCAGAAARCLAPPTAPAAPRVSGKHGQSGGGARAPGLGALSGMGGAGVGEAPRSAPQVGGREDGGGRRCGVHDNRVNPRAGTWS